jgi:hypothetical protein
LRPRTHGSAECTWAFLVSPGMSGIALGWSCSCEDLAGELRSREDCSEGLNQYIIVFPVSISLEAVTMQPVILDSSPVHSTDPCTGDFLHPPATAIPTMTLRNVPVTAFSCINDPPQCLFATTDPCNDDSMRQRSSETTLSPCNVYLQRPTDP